MEELEIAAGKGTGPGEMKKRLQDYSHITQSLPFKGKAAQTSGDLVIDFALTIQRAIFDKRLLAEMDYGGFISDRTLLDTYCYMLMWCHQGMTDSVARSLFVVTLENMKKYDAIFYFPLEAFRTTDETSGMRAQGAAQALLMDNLLKGFLLKAFPGYSVVPGAGVEQRTEHILDTIRRYKKWKS